MGIKFHIIGSSPILEKRGQGLSASGRIRGLPAGNSLVHFFGEWDVIDKAYKLCIPLNFIQINFPSLSEYILVAPSPSGSILLTQNINNLIILSWYFISHNSANFKTSHFAQSLRLAPILLLEIR